LEKKGEEMKYDEFIQSKIKNHKQSGFEVEKLNKNMFEFQKFIIKKALKSGKYAIFADCGLGKTLMQLEWAYRVSEYTNKPVLILAPLAVSGQTINEGKKFGINVKKYDGTNFPIQITNYEQLDNIDASNYTGIVLDESSILKNFEGETKN
jgi:CRISPR/Cas system-associated endonuclease/helicase Cas3